MTDGANVPTIEMHEAHGDILSGHGAELDACRERDELLAQRMADLEAKIDECECGTVDIDPPVIEPPVEPVPPIEPEPPADDLYAGVPANLLALPMDYRDKENRTAARLQRGFAVVDGIGGMLYNFDQVLIQDGTWTGDGDHDGDAIAKCEEVYVINATLDGFQHFYHAGGGVNAKTIMRNVTMRNVGEDAIRNVTGLIENVNIESSKPHGDDPHGDTVDLKYFTNGLEIRGLRSVTGKLNGIITADVKNLVIDGYEHLGEPTHLSIDIGGDAENVTIRNCKLSGSINFRGSKRNVNIDWDTVREKVPREEFV